MHKLFLVAALAALAGCSQQPAAQTDADANVANAAADANATAATASKALATINETSWEFMRDGKLQLSSVDASGNYITNAGSEHIDHGTAVMKDGKACFTSAMTKDGEICWTDPMIAEGEAGETINQRGEKLPLTRKPYTPLTM